MARAATSEKPHAEVGACANAAQTLRPARGDAPPGVRTLHAARGAVNPRSKFLTPSTDPPTTIPRRDAVHRLILLGVRHLRVLRQLKADHGVARRLERDRLAAPPAGVLCARGEAGGAGGAGGGGRTQAACLERVRGLNARRITPGMASGPKCPCPGMRFMNDLVNGS